MMIADFYLDCSRLRHAWEWGFDVKGSWIGQLCAQGDLHPWTTNRCNRMTFSAASRPISNQSQTCTSRWRGVKLHKLNAVTIIIKPTRAALSLHGSGRSKN